MRAWTLGLLVAAGLAMPVSSEAKPAPPPPSAADEFRASLTRDGFTVLQVPKENIKLGDLYSADHRFQDACVVLDEGAVRDQSMGESQSEAKRQRGFAPTLGLGPLKAGVRKEVMLYKFTDVLDRRHRLVARSALVPSPACKQFLSTQQRRGMDLTGWYVVQETVSASVLEITCDSKEKAIEFQAEMRKPSFNPRVSLDADRSDSCFGKNTTVGVIALRHVPISELLPAPSTAAPPQPQPPPEPVVTDAGPQPIPLASASSTEREKLQRFWRACRSGRAANCNSLGVMYADGRVVTKDDTRAVSLLKQACDGGNTMGCRNLGFNYRKGIGVTKDDTRAVSLYKQACDGGDAVGCRILGFMYKDGECVTKDDTRAVSLFKQACDGGDAWTCEYLIEEGL